MATLWLHRRNVQEKGTAAHVWLLLRSVAAGCGIAACNLIAFLGFEPHLRAAMSPWAVALAFALAIIATAPALAARLTSLLRSEFAGAALTTLSFALVHFALLWGFRPQGAMHWSLAYQAAAVGTTFALALAARYAGGPQPGPARSALAIGLITLAVASMHIVSLAGVDVRPYPGQAAGADLTARALLAGTAAGLSLLVLLSALAVAGFESLGQQKGLRQLRVATNAMPAALAFFEANDRLVVWNTAFEQVFGGGGLAVREGMSVADMISGMAGPGAGPPPPAGAVHQRLSSEFMIPTGQWIRVDNVPTDDGGLLCVGIDITEIKRSEAALAKALDSAEAANRAKSEFLANMSHEIRTPLNGVSGLSDVLARTGLDSQQRELVEVIRQSARVVDALVGDILDLSHMEAGRAQVDRAPFHLGALVRDAAARHRPVADGKGLGLIAEVAPEAEAVVDGDHARLAQVLDKLLSNAVKFTAAGEVRVGVKALEGEIFRLEVRDTGVGFDPDDKARLFDRFAQGDGSATRRFGGAGLGLALVRECARLMGGTLDCDSQPGQGSVFSFDVQLPAAAAPAPDLSLTPVADAADILAGPEIEPDEETPLQVMVVDDNATNRRVLELILGQLGARILSVENGQEAVEAFDQGGFDLILMDVQMPVMDGLTATREIRKRELSASRPTTPVIIVSANCMPEHVKAGLDAGAQQYLGKPVGAQALIDAINSVFSSSGHQAAA